MTLRIATWNCFRGDPAERLAELSGFDVDVVCLQEVKAPSNGISNSHYRPKTSVQGVFLWARPDLLLTPAGNDTGSGSCALAAIGERQALGVAGVWAQTAPSYVANAIETIESAVSEFDPAPLLVLGDFNASPALVGGRAGFERLIARTKQAQLVSAYHVMLGEEFGAESTPTFYWRRDEAAPFHIDYCFVPEAWAPLIRSVEVPGFGEFRTSDHRPIIVELDLDPGML